MVVRVQRFQQESSPNPSQCDRGGGWGLASESKLGLGSGKAFSPVMYSVHRRRGRTAPWTPSPPPLAPPPPTPLPIFEADSQNFAWAPLAPRGFKLQKFLARLPRG